MRCENVAYAMQGRSKMPLLTRCGAFLERARAAELNGIFDHTRAWPHTDGRDGGRHVDHGLDTVRLTRFG